ncbi:MAG: hypothetical protein ABSE42_21125, partial [Bryobacteraceae bacterium]
APKPGRQFGANPELAGESACPTLLGRPDEYWLFCMTHYTSSQHAQLRSGPLMKSIRWRILVAALLAIPVAAPASGARRFRK